MWDSFVEWSERHPEAIGLAALASVGTFVGSLLFLPILLARLPANYFSRERRPPTPWRARHPYLRLVVLALKNVVGALLLVSGILMLVLPGQGILTILAALVLLDFPGKRRLERALVRRPRVLRGIDWIRARAGVMPMEPPPPAHGPTDAAPE